MFHDHFGAPQACLPPGTHKRKAATTSFYASMASVETAVWIDAML
jgi:hypothetical protein